MDWPLEDLRVRTVRALWAGVAVLLLFCLAYTTRVALTPPAVYEFGPYFDFDTVVTIKIVLYSRTEAESVAEGCLDHLEYVNSQITEYGEVV